MGSLHGWVVMSYLGPIRVIGDLLFSASGPFQKLRLPRTRGYEGQMQRAPIVGVVAMQVSAKVSFKSTAA